MEINRPPEESTDDMFIRLALADADLYDQPVGDAVARCIANQYHEGQTSALYSFVSTGALKGEDLGRELARHHNNAESHEKPPLDQLIRYVTAHGDEAGEREPVEGWHEQSKWDTGNLSREVMKKFGKVATGSLIRRMENAPDFGYDDEEYELARRLKLLGRTWRWTTGLDGREVVEVVEVQQ